MLKLIMPLMKTKIKRTLGRISCPYKLNLHITYNCNSRCRTCFIWEKYIKHPELREKELKKEQWKKFFRNMGKNVYWVSISGGEPFLREDIAEIVASIKTENLCLLSINTNGQSPEKIYAAMKKILEAIPKKVSVFLAISLLGSEKTHDKISGKEGAFLRSEETYKKLGHLRKRHGNFHVERELVFSKDNLGEIENVVSRLNRDRVPFTLTFAQESDYYDNRGRKVGFSPGEKERVVRILKNIEIPIYRKKDAVKLVFRDLAIRFFQGSGTVGCSSSWASLRVDPYGNVYPCIMINEVLGNLTENDMDLRKTILRSKKIAGIQRDIKRGMCSCWTPCEAYQNIIQNPHLLIKKIREFIR